MSLRGSLVCFATVRFARGFFAVPRFAAVFRFFVFPAIDTLLRAPV